MTRLGLILALALGIVSLSGVSLGREQSSSPTRRRRRIIVSQDKQLMLIYEGTVLVRQLPISTGWPGVRKTQTPDLDRSRWRVLGYLFVVRHHPGSRLLALHRSPGDGEWNGDILIHGAPYTVDPAGAKSLQPRHIGKMPASHGCIQLLPDDAEWFHRWDPVGVPITIAPSPAAP